MPEPPETAPEPSAPEAATPRLPCPRCKHPTLVEVRVVEAPLKMALLLLPLFWFAGVGLPLVLAVAAIVGVAWPPLRRWRCERRADCGYQQANV